MLVYQRVSATFRDTYISWHNGRPRTVLVRFVTSSFCGVLGGALGLALGNMGNMGNMASWTSLIWLKLWVEPIEIGGANIRKNMDMIVEHGYDNMDVMHQKWCYNVFFLPNANVERCLAMYSQSNWAMIPIDFYVGMGAYQFQAVKPFGAGLSKCFPLVSIPNMASAVPTATWSQSEVVLKLELSKLYPRLYIECYNRPYQRGWNSRLPSGNLT